MRIVKESPRDQIESLSKIIRVFENVTSKLLKTTEIQKTLNSLDFPSFHAFRITLQNASECIWIKYKKKNPLCGYIDFPPQKRRAFAKCFNHKHSQKHTDSISTWD